MEADGLCRTALYLFREPKMLENVELRLIPSGPASSIQVRKLTLTDVVGSLRSGWDDFMAYPSHAVMLAIIYPIVGLSIARVLQGYSFFPLLFPLSAGFALLGPFAAIVFYDLSRRRGRGGIPSAANVMDIIHSVSSGASRIARRNVGRTVPDVGGYCSVHL
jgi:uncharacterized membrane protein